MTATLTLGDCVTVMAAMPDCSVDAIVTDPPYALEFMGKEWDRFRSDDRDVPGYNGRESGSLGEATTDGVAGDHAARRNRAVAYGGGQRATTSRCEGCGKRDQFRKPHACPDGTNWRTELVDPYAAPPSMLAFQNWTREWALQALRVLKPGGHLLAFGGTRTYHRLAAGLEDAGFEIRDCVAWLYGSGFPKSLDVSKAIDAAAGAERPVVGSRPLTGTARIIGGQGASAGRAEELYATHEMRDRLDLTAPATAEAQRWDGWGTALKPAFEPVVVARKPLAGTVAANVLEHGTGALNIDACRIEFADDDDEAESKGKNRHADFGSGPRDNAVYGQDARDRGEHGNYDPPGRWPANVTLDPEAAAALDAQTGDVIGGHWPSARPANRQAGHDGLVERHADVGGASRFFYCAKTSRAERNAGLDGFVERERPHEWSQFVKGRSFVNGEWVETGSETTASRNNHPTVKPIALMRWLVRLVTPPDGLVLDPFLGSGTTGVAAGLEGFRFAGVERDPDYLRIAEARIAFWAEHGEAALELVAAREQAELRRREIADSGQLDLLTLTDAS